MCTLSPQARAFSSVLSALIGSIVNGLSSGWLIAFITGWITWFAFFRVTIGGSYMLYRSLTLTWPLEGASNEFEMLGRAASPDPESTAQEHLINQNSQDQFIESELGGGNVPPNSPPSLSELPADGVSEEAYHHHVYTIVFLNGDSPSDNTPKESAFSTFWSTRSDLDIRQQNYRYARQKRTELRKYYASDNDLKRGLRAYSAMITAGKLPGPLPTLSTP